MNAPFSVRTLLSLSALALLGACATPYTLPWPNTSPPPSAGQSAAGVPGIRKAEQDFALGRRAYEDGDYPTATRQLQSAVNGNLAARERVVAHKYLAFIACAQSQLEVCRTHFRHALELNPQFTLSASESGHPTWGPVFRELAAESAKRAPRR
jgi:Tfp pilus assembly protein PilF